ncbi:hypothetical protein VCUG_02615 [Vavraia culicis subsp. floridensis]|uniref:Uncharacterized protein n=1 Tax=Vavraia culicis (isolate floridensis) TaxID=948595 RepID=L2GS48_VAVCU|nr:uncharacterized protein VCUG_02615 [Vavraia culicis subsp. floridensis]ELA45895.1 hypothetical protein VCUG_02615 [Vavraia culicis subsp. floridensis]
MQNKKRTIIIGCVVGAAVLAVVILCCCFFRSSNEPDADGDISSNSGGVHGSTFGSIVNPFHISSTFSGTSQNAISNPASGNSDAAKDETADPGASSGNQPDSSANVANNDT